MMDHILEQMLEQQLISQGGHQLFSLSLISITLAIIIHDIVCLALIYMHLYISSICLSDSHAYACPTLCRTLHVKSDGWILRVRVGETCFCMTQRTSSWLMTHAIDSMYITIAPRCDYSHCRVTLTVCLTHLHMLSINDVLNYYNHSSWAVLRRTLSSHYLELR